MSPWHRRIDIILLLEIKQFYELCILILLTRRLTKNTIANPCTLELNSHQGRALRYEKGHLELAL